MKRLDHAAMRALRLLPPETAHEAALKALRAGLAPGRMAADFDPALRLNVAGLDFPNPLGLAAGFDKNALVYDAMLARGFGFVEVGAATPRAQPGNARPRLFRLEEDRAVINRFGFNNNGLEAMKTRLKAGRSGIVGVNLGANKDSADRAADYAQGLAALYDDADFFTINVSSPNTEKLRDLQAAEALEALLARALGARPKGAHKPVFLKIAPDLTPSQLEDAMRVALSAGVDGVIATNTTLARDGLTSRHAPQAGGLSGAPLFERSTQILRDAARILEGRIPLIGVGGVETGAQAYAKIRAGASLVQLYTALIYQGPGLTGRILRELGDLMRKDGFERISQAVGADVT